MLHNEVIQKKISPFIQSQLPLYIDLQYDTVAGKNISVFGRFLQLYYEWLETSGNAFDRLIRMQSFRDIDTTLETLIKYFSSEYTEDFPETMEADPRKLIKRIKEFYRTRGSKVSVELLFRILYDLKAVVEYRKDKILRASDATWYRKMAVRAKEKSGYGVINADLSQAKGYYVVGETSGAKAVVENTHSFLIGTTAVVDLMLDRSTLTGTFTDGESLKVETDTGSEVYKTGTTLQLKADSVNSIQGIDFTTNGSGYFIDDVIILANTTDSEIIIKALTDGPIEEIYSFETIVSGDVGKEVNFVNSYMAVYGVEGDFSAGDSITGTVSGAKATIRAIDTSTSVTKYWIDGITGNFRTDEKYGEYSGEEVLNDSGSSYRFRIDKIIEVCDVSATAYVKSIVGGIEVVSGGNYTSLPKVYVGSLSVTDILAHGKTVGGIKEVEVIKHGSASGSSTASFRDVRRSQTSGTLIKDNSYTITTYVSSDDFTGVGASSNATGVEFVATGITPTSWDDDSVLKNNTLTTQAIGTVTYGAVVEYQGEWTKGSILDPESRIQDLVDYFQWTYSIRASKDPSEWKEKVKNITHPSGMRMVASYTIDTNMTHTQTVGTTVINA